MINHNGGRFRNDWRSMTNGKREGMINVEDLALDGDTGGGNTKSAEEIAAEVEAKRLANEAAASGGELKYEDLIKDVENETIKGLEEEAGKTLLEIHKGVGFDKDGNIVDGEGTIVKNFDDYKEEIKVDGGEDDDPLKDTLEVEIEGVKYKLDENKNAIKEDGTTVKTKEEILEMLKEDADDTDDDYVNQISSVTGFEAKDDKGELLTFENTVEGLAAREVHIVKQEAKKLATQELDAFFGKNQDILKMVEFKKIHGTLDDFAKSKDYKEVVVEDSNEDQHRSIIVEAEMAQGKDETRAKAYAELIISDGKGKAEADASLKFLQDKQSSDIATAKGARDLEETAAKETYTKFTTEVAEVVKSGTANGFAIPEYIEAKFADGTKSVVHRNSIFQLVTEPDENGVSRYDKMVQNDSVETKVLDAYMRMTGYDFKKLAGQRAANDKVINLKNTKKTINGKVTLVKKVVDTVTAGDIA